MVTVAAEKRWVLADTGVGTAAEEHQPRRPPTLGRGAANNDQTQMDFRKSRPTCSREWSCFRARRGRRRSVLRTYGERQVHLRKEPNAVSRGRRFSDARLRRRWDAALPDCRLHHAGPRGTAFAR